MKMKMAGEKRKKGVSERVWPDKVVILWQRSGDDGTGHLMLAFSLLIWIFALFFWICLSFCQFFIEDLPLKNK